MNNFTNYVQDILVHTPMLQKRVHITDVNRHGVRQMATDIQTAREAKCES